MNDITPRKRPAKVAKATLLSSTSATKAEAKTVTKTKIKTAAAMSTPKKATQTATVRPKTLVKDVVVKAEAKPKPKTQPKVATTKVALSVKAKTAVKTSVKTTKPSASSAKVSAKAKIEPVKSSAPKTTVKPKAAKPSVSRKKATVKEVPVPLPESIDVNEPRVAELSLPSKKRRPRWLPLVVILSLFAIIVGLPTGAFLWYQDQQRPVDSSSTKNIRVVIEQGMTPEMIGERLDENKLIKSRGGFEWYLRLTRSGSHLQAGVYSLSQNMTLSDIIDHLQAGKTDTFRITLLPGATVMDNKEALINSGFSKDEVEAAFAKRYDHTILKGRPASADLEGYIYGETYEFPSNVTVERILTRTFDELEKVVATHNLVAIYRRHGLTLYEGITLASIIQREAFKPSDQKKIAGVFYNRLRADMNLGSDVTYQYIADKTGQERDPTLDSPYNTRVHTGLPPGPIAVPGKSALLAVAQPAKSDYLYFLSGDDDVTYFGRTEAEHQRNIENHCQKKCQIL